MEQSSDKQIDIKHRIIFLLRKYKLSFIILLAIIILSVISFTLFEIKNKKKNSLNSEKYIQAGLYLANEDKEKSKKIFEEIILDKSEFYSILALNSILEKNLEKDKEKILSYFEIINRMSKTQEQNDIVKFKKALYLIKNSSIQEGKAILKELVEENSKLTILAKDILEE